MVTGVFYVEKPPTAEDTVVHEGAKFMARTFRKMSAAFSALRQSWRLVYTICVPVLLLPVAVCIGGKEGWCAYILLWMACYWSAEVVPLAATSLMPVFLFPFFGIISSQSVATFYLNDIGIVMLCSLIMAGAVETSNLHRRIALKSLLAIGTSNLRLLLGFMLVTMSLSMWIPNTASTSIMAPIVMAVVDQMHTASKPHPKDVESSDVESLNVGSDVDSYKEKTKSSNALTQAAEAESESRQKALRTTMLLSVAYAANIGGTGSLVGTGPNLVLKGLIDDLFPGSTELTFATWMLYNVPTMLICVLIGWIYLQFTARRELFPEWSVTFLMSSMIILWFTMKPQMFPGWAELLPYGKYIKSSAPAMIATFLLFVIPKNPRRPQSRPLITWREASDRAQWGVMILIGGGMCLAEGCKKSGLSALLVEHLKGLDALPNVITVFVLCFAASMFTEITSNTAVSSILLPVVCEMAVAIGVHPLYLAMPVTIGCSFSFMLPAATPPNAIVYELAELSIPQMAKPGFVMNMVCVVVEVGMIHALGFPIFGLGTFPAWATPAESTPTPLTGDGNATGLPVITTIVPTH